MQEMMAGQKTLVSPPQYPKPLYYNENANNYARGRALSEIGACAKYERLISVRFGVYNAASPANPPKCKTRKRNEMAFGTLWLAKWRATRPRIQKSGEGPTITLD